MVVLGTVDVVVFGVSVVVGIDEGVTVVGAAELVDGALQLSMEGTLGPLMASQTTSLEL